MTRPPGSAHAAARILAGAPAGALVLVGALALAGTLTAAAAAQDLVGVAVGPDGEPLVGATIVLHRVGAGGGAIAGTDTTDADGGFAFALPPDSAVYFAALRYEGRIYVGPAAQAGDVPVTEYVLEVGPATEISAVSGQLSASPTGPAGGQAVPRRATGGAGGAGGAGGGGSDTGALWLVSLLALSAAAVFVYTAPRYRWRRTREAVIEIAEIENRLDGDALDPTERDGLADRRDRLKEQLAPPA